jgi:hypothetical protein
VSLYAKVTKVDGEETLVGWSGDDPARAGLRLLRSADHFAFQSRPDGMPVRSTSVIVPNTWYHIVVTKTDQAITLYVNGNAEDRQPAPLRLENPGRPLTLGGDGAGRTTFHGWLDEVGLYSRALTAREVRDLYELRESGPCKL